VNPTFFRVLSFLNPDFRLPLCTELFFELFFKFGEDDPLPCLLPFRIDNMSFEVTLSLSSMIYFGL